MREMIFVSSLRDISCPESTGHRSLFPYFRDHPLFGRAYPMALDQDYQGWDEATPCGWDPLHHPQLVGELIDRFRPCFPTEHRLQDQLCRIIERYQDSDAGVLTSRTRLRAGGIHAPLIRRSSTGAISVHPDSILLDHLCTDQTYLTVHRDVIHIAPRWTPPTLYTPDQVQVTRTTPLWQRRSEPQTPERDPSPTGVQLIDDERYSYPSMHLRPLGWGTPPRILFHLPDMLLNPTGKDPQSNSLQPPTFAAGVQASSFRFQMGLIPELAHIQWSLDRLRVIRDPNNMPTIVSNRYFDGVGEPLRPQGMMLTAIPILSAEAFLDIALAMGGKAYPLPPDPQAQLMGGNNPPAQEYQGLHGVRQRGPNPDYDYRETLNRFNLTEDRVMRVNQHRTYLMRRIHRYKALWSRSFGPEGIKPLWLLSRVEQAKSFESFPLDTGNVAANLRDPSTSDLWSPFGIELTLPAGRQWIPEYDVSTAIPSPLYKGVDPCVLHTAGTNSAWLVDLFELNILRAELEGSPLIWDTVFRTFHRTEHSCPAFTECAGPSAPSTLPNDAGVLSNTSHPVYTVRLFLTPIDNHESFSSMHTYGPRNDTFYWPYCRDAGQPDFPLYFQPEEIA